MPIKSAPNCTVTYNAINVTQYLTTAGLKATVEAIETTNLASTAKESAPGNTDWSLDLAGEWAKALDDAIMPDVITPPATLRTLVVTYGTAGAIATYTWTNKAFPQAYNPTADATTTLKFTATIGVNGAPART